jgi:hypothetical protein
VKADNPRYINIEEAAVLIQGGPEEAEHILLQAVEKAAARAKITAFLPITDPSLGPSWMDIVRRETLASIHREVRRVPAASPRCLVRWRWPPRLTHCTARLCKINV